MEGNPQSGISPAGKGFIEKAQALILLKDILGAAWVDQKKNFLELFFTQVNVLFCNLNCRASL